MRKKSFFSIIAVIITAAVIFTACGKKEVYYEALGNHTKWHENFEMHNLDIKYDLANGTDIRSFDVKKGDTYNFKYDIKSKKGTIDVKLTDSKGNILLNVPVSNINEKETNEANGSIKIHNNDTKIKIIIDNKNSAGSIKIKW